MKRAAIVLLLAVIVQGLDWSHVKSRQVARPTQVNSRIVGGSVATPGQFPHQVWLVLDRTKFCGGSLISSSTVLTAASCADGTKSFEVHLGAHNIEDPNEANLQVVTSRVSLLHQGWNPAILENDIAVVTLPSTVSGPGIEIIRMPSRSSESESLVGEVGRVSGWGTTSDADPPNNFHPELKYTDLTIINNNTCGNTYGNIINSSKLCANTLGGSQTTCTGDTGGALTVPESDGIRTQVGVVSFWSSAGCESGAPVVFSRVTSYLTWLEANAGITIRP